MYQFWSGTTLYAAETCGSEGLACNSIANHVVLAVKTLRARSRFGESPKGES